MSTRAVIINIAINNLDPKVNHFRVDKKGNFVGQSKSVEVVDKIIEVEQIQDVVEEVKDELETEDQVSAVDDIKENDEIIDEKKVDKSVVKANISKKRTRRKKSE